MSGPSYGARERATKALANVAGRLAPGTYDRVLEQVAESMQEAFDLGHKSAGGAQMDKPPAMGGFLEIALDQEEIDALGWVIDFYLTGHGADVDDAVIERFAEKIALFRRKR